MHNSFLEDVTEMFINCTVCFIQFHFDLYYRRFYDSGTIQNIGREGELNHAVDYVIGLRILEFMLQDRE